MTPLSDRETSTILAALRLWQKYAPRGHVTDELKDIASNGEEFEPLDELEIDDLCEKLNGQ